ncbi:RNA polymerase sigma factor [Pseudobacteriovorax antillogorgiicola]|uniref:RNA polymerase sigma-70 factor, ECF subfamily n=1 Tax=Pseudobacteriovorax antillogorgiicola TaxID=1513793 RepID=A0A1Y6CSF1_9BACT|nr:sigma-70 family RNA polymerase sigma factor [Pseudobacteriovorax antillogorgiicola]TCS45670.1 RNA polymerase sigma-70 factor (ECF subfamily) [Pseudobacteriovorax antillogorgiicola]SMF73081.1 RNA polymerase sigma-70 factor, ECF subfamily [Pseudobacteriovorax antillogorgiicola]
MDIAAWYEKYSGMVYRRCLELLKQPEKAEEAMQEVFIKVVKRQNQLHEQGPSSYLYQSATHTCLNIIRKDSKLKETSDLDILTSIACGEDFEELGLIRLTARRVLGETSVSTRVMATLHYVDGLTLQEVADEVNMSLSGVRKRLRQFKSEAQNKGV